MRQGMIYEPIRPGRRSNFGQSPKPTTKVMKPIVPDNEFDLRDWHPDDELVTHSANFLSFKRQSDEGLGNMQRDEAHRNLPFARNQFDKANARNKTGTSPKKSKTF